MSNPTSAIDAILTSEKEVDNIKIYPMTLARYALLELVESPFVSKNSKFTVTNLVPSFYIMCSPIEALKGINSKNIEQLNERALIWAEALPSTSTDKLIPAIMEALGLIQKVAPSTA